MLSNIWTGTWNSEGFQQSVAANLQRLLSLKGQWKNMWYYWGIWKDASFLLTVPRSRWPRKSWDWFDIKLHLEDPRSKLSLFVTNYYVMLHRKTFPPSLWFFFCLFVFFQNLLLLQFPVFFKELCKCWKSDHLK